MSFAVKRAEFAAALSTVADCHGFEVRPSTPNIGDAWVVQGRGERAAGDAFIITWLIRVFVPQDDVSATVWWDQHWPALYYALKPVAFVDAFDPILLENPGGSQLAYQITARAEE